MRISAMPTIISRTALPLIGVGALALCCGSCGGGRDGGGSSKAKFQRELMAMGLPAGPGRSDVLQAADIAAFPAPVRRYLTFMGVVGRPRDWSFRADLTGRFRTKPRQAWMPMEAWQYNSSVEPARVFYIRVRFFGLMPVLARDTYLHGQGRMLVRPLDLFTADDAGGPELAVSELVTYLNDAILLAPSMIIGPGCSWTAADDQSFDVALTHGGHTVRARVSVDAQGAPRDFSTTDRFVEDPDDPGHRLIQARWTTPIDGWQEAHGRRLPTAGRAIWHLPAGDFTYVEMAFSPEKVAFNVPPGA
jgi:hypothetical protein